MPTDKKTADQIAEEAVADATREIVEEKPKEEQAQVPDPAEVSARAQGWKPKGEFTGDPALWVDAKEFLGRAPLFEKIKDQGKVLKKMEKTVDAMARHFEKNLEAAVASRIATLRDARKEAIEAGDVANVEKIDKQIDEQKAVKTDIKVEQQVHPEVEAFVNANPWYVNDREMHDFAYAYNETYLKGHPGDLTGCLKAVLTATKRAFPDKFPADKKPDPPAASAAPAVESGTAPSKEAVKYTVNRLTSEQKLVYDQIVKKHGIVKHDKFFQDLEAIGELK